MSDWGKLDLGDWIGVVAMASYAIDVTAAVTLLVEHSVTNTADRNDIEMVELEITH